MSEPAPTLRERGFFWWNEVPIVDRFSMPSSAIGGQLTIDGDHIRLDLDATLPNQDVIETVFMPLGEKISRPIQGLLLPSRKRVLLPELINYGGYFVAFDCLVADTPFLANTPPEVRSMTIDLSSLRGWIQSDALQSNSDRERQWHRVEYRRPQAAIYELQDKKIEISFSGKIKRSDDGVSLYDQTTFVYSGTNPTPLDEQYALFGVLNDFFILLIGVNFDLPRPLLKLQDGRTCEWYLFRGATENAGTRIIGHECWTTFPAVRDQLGELWQRWAELHKKSGAGVYLYLSNLRRKDLYHEHSFANLIWGLEAFHRNNYPEEPSTSHAERLERIFSQISDQKDLKWLQGRLKNSHEPALGDRIAFILKSLPTGLDRTALHAFSHKCANLRHQISHWGGNKEGTAYLDFLHELERFGGVLSTLYHYLILHKIGVDAKTLNSWLSEGRGQQSRAIRRAFMDVGLSFK